MKANFGRTETDAWDALRKEESKPRSADIALSLCPNILPQQLIGRTTMQPDELAGAAAESALNVLNAVVGSSHS
jgi:hypothetical protein